MDRNAQLHTNSTFHYQLHGQQYLDIAIKKEFCQGKGNLPISSPPPFFKHSIEQLTALPIMESKIKWFRTIRTAREDNGSDIPDEFTYLPSLSTWIGFCPK
jgi:hypothetical protein